MLFSTKGVSKQFGGIYALKNVDFSIDRGEIHGLIGENGAGKSTLIKILTGVYHMDEGIIFLNGSKVSIKNPSDARTLGINVIHQDRMLVPSFTAVENAYLGRPYPRHFGKINWKEMSENVVKAASDLGIEIDPSQTASQMSPPQKTCLEIVRAMMNECSLLILDEPTAALTNRESELLFRTIDSLKKRGTSILYVSHRMDEILRLTDRITILKNGETVTTVTTKDTDREKLISMMTDNWSAGNTLLRKKAFGPPMLEVQGLQSRDGSVKQADLTAHEGEILGLFGLGGSGRTELLECIYGLRAVANGSICIQNKTVSSHTPADSIRNGMALICEDRRGKGLISNLSVRDNIPLSNIRDYSLGGIISDIRLDKGVADILEQLEVRLASPKQRVIELSGGNQQKVVFSRTLMTHPRIFLCDEPTQAVDVKTRREIHSLLRRLADNGGTVVLVTSDLKEMLEIADRIQIISGGKTGIVLENNELCAQDVLSLCYANA